MMHAVTDVRVSADVRIESGDGFVELAISKYFDKFYARLYADGRLTLERVGQDGQRQDWGQTRIAIPNRPLRVSIGHADYQVVVEVDEAEKLRSPDSYTAAET